MKYLHLLWRNLLRRKVRTLFTFLSIVVAFFLFGLLSGVRNSFDIGIELAGANRLLTIHKVSLIQMLPIRYVQQIASTPGVAFATHMTWFGGIYQDPKNFFANMAVDPEGILRAYPEFKIVDADQRAKWVSTRTGALVGRKLAERFGWKVGDRIPLKATFWRPKDGKSDTFEFDLVALYEGDTQNVDETQFFFHYKYLMERTGDPGLAGWFVVEVADPDHADAVAAAIDRQFANSPAETKTATEKAFVQSFAKQVGNTGAILAAIAAIVFFVILLISGNTMAQSVRERTNELGVLKTLGFTDARVMGLVLGESVLLAGLGGIVGLALVVLAAPGFAKMLETFLPIFYVPTRSVVQGVVMAIVLGVATGGIPAWSALRLSVVDALRKR